MRLVRKPKSNHKGKSRAAFGDWKSIAGSNGKNNPMPDVSINEEDFPHELEFTANAASWMNLIIEKDPALPFSSAKCEGRSRGSQKRRDLTLTGKDGKVLVTGEVKLP